MLSKDHQHLYRTVLLVLALVVLLAAAACGSKASKQAASGGTASGNLKAAESAVTTATANMKLLMVAIDSTTTSDKPVFTYIFGSPDNGQMYSVSITNGKTMGAVDAGPAPLKESEWASVPKDGSWKIDSDEAYDKAIKKSGIKDTPAAFSMLLNTYSPESSKGNAKPMTWYVSFSTTGASDSASLFEVDAMTGDVTEVQQQ